MLGVRSPFGGQLPKGNKRKLHDFCSSCQTLALVLLPLKVEDMGACGQAQGRGLLSTPGILGGRACRSCSKGQAAQGPSQQPSPSHHFTRERQRRGGKEGETGREGGRDREGRRERHTQRQRERGGGGEEGRGGLGPQEHALWFWNLLPGFEAGWDLP